MNDMNKVNSFDEQSKVNQVLLDNDAEIIKGHELLNDRVGKMEENFHNWELDIKDIFYDMEKKITQGVSQGNAPVIEAIDKDRKERIDKEERDRLEREKEADARKHIDDEIHARLSLLENKGDKRIVDTVKSVAKWIVVFLSGALASYLRSKLGL